MTRMTGTIFGQGFVKGQLNVLQRQLERRFGSLSPAVLEKLATWPAERLPELADQLLTAKSLRELGLEESVAAETTT